MTTQLNVRLPDVVIAEINELAEDYGSQANVGVRRLCRQENPEGETRYAWDIVSPRR